MISGGMTELSLSSLSTEGTNFELPSLRG
jgi:hypothetical protein